MTPKSRCSTQIMVRQAILGVYTRGAANQPDMRCLVDSKGQVMRDHQGVGGNAEKNPIGGAGRAGMRSSAIGRSAEMRCGDVGTPLPAMILT